MKRKPNIRERIAGCFACLKEVIIGFFTFDISRMQLFWMLFEETAMGHCEVLDKDECSKYEWTQYVDWSE